ncbi:hypothetical protein [Streptomyces rubiginosohelvolus]|uniref:hypothetical protein n=1 Tax=Streptomyces rubiginosohelvolus TaxID=67362 RepID=UPI0035D76FAD
MTSRISTSTSHMHGVPICCSSACVVRSASFTITGLLSVTFRTSIYGTLTDRVLLAAVATVSLQGEMICAFENPKKLVLHATFFPPATGV